MDFWVRRAQCCIRFCTDDGGCEGTFARSAPLPALEIYLSQPCATHGARSRFPLVELLLLACFLWFVPCRAFGSGS
jgi:hypothetical protein